MALLALACLPAMPVPPPALAGVAASLPSPAASGGGTDRGSGLYLRNCASCHGNRGEGSQRGPSLVGVGAASVDFQLSTGRMPIRQTRYQPLHREPAFSEADIDALVRHVSGFGGDGPPVPAVGPGDPRTGRELFLANCAACHSATGKGAVLTYGQIAPSLDQATPTQVAEAIRVGPGVMPAFPDTVLSAQGIDSIAAYVQVLRGERGRLDRGGIGLGRIGPLAEGLMAWVVGLGVLVGVIRWLGTRAGR